MVAERFAVDRNRPDRAGRRAVQRIGPAVRIRQQGTEGDVVRQSAVVGEHRDRPATVERDLHGAAAFGHARDLMRCEHGERNPRRGNDVERFTVDRRFRQPKPHRVSPEAALEVVDAPANFGFLVAP